MQSPLTRKLSCFGRLSQDDLVVFKQLLRRRRRFCAGQELIQEGEKIGVAFVLVEGWSCSYKILRDGDRQIVDFQILAISWACAASCFTPPITARRL